MNGCERLFKAPALLEFRTQMVFLWVVTPEGVTLLTILRCTFLKKKKHFYISEIWMHLTAHSGS